MPVFTYAADGLKGTVTADSPRQARERLRTRGVAVEQLTRQEVAPRRSFRTRASSTAKLTSATRELSTLLSAGIGLVEALSTLAGQTKGPFQTSLQILRDEVASGSSLAAAMRDQPQTFDELTIQMVEVGENSGTLDTVLDQLADFKERSLQFKDRVFTALLYPSIVVLLSLGVSIFLMTVVLPMLLENLLEAGKTLPWPTRVLKVASDTLSAHGWWLALTCGAIFFGFLAAIRTPAGRRMWHRAILKLPLVGPMAKKQELSRIALVVSTLLKSGIVFVEAMRIAQRTTKNVILRQALSETQAAVGTGSEIGSALEHTKIFPPVVVQIFTVGQETGRLEELLDRLSESYERQVASMSARLAAALEPILIVFLALFVGFILFATILPILEAGNVL